MGATLEDSVRLYNRYHDCQYMQSLYQNYYPDASVPGSLGAILTNCMSMTISEVCNFRDFRNSFNEYGQRLLNNYWDCADKRVTFYKANGITTPEEYRFADLDTRCEGGAVFRQCMNETMDTAAPWIDTKNTAASWDDTMWSTARVVVPTLLIPVTACTTLAARAWNRGETLKAGAYLVATVALIASGGKMVLG